MIQKKDFTCLQCGNCCKGEGTVTVSQSEFTAICEYLALDYQDAVHYYFVKNGKKFSVRDQKNHDCIFLRKDQCLIHEVKPEQCRNFPFSWNIDFMLEECKGYQAMLKKEQEQKELTQ